MREMQRFNTLSPSSVSLSVCRCAVIPDIPAGESYNYSCGGMEGRYVNLIIPGDMKTLTICELEVYGEGETY